MFSVRRRSPSTPARPSGSFLFVITSISVMIIDVMIVIVIKALIAELQADLEAANKLAKDRPESPGGSQFRCL